MQTLQKWFDLLAGVSAEEEARRQRAHAIFARRNPDLEALQLPACWRRPARHQ